VTGLDVFEAERPRLAGLAYRLLGSITDAEDVVQEAWIRWHAAEQASIENPAGWLTTVVSRLGLDRLRARQREREVYVGPWLPEPLISAIDDPAEMSVTADSLTTAFLWMLERLSPEERLVMLLADVFGESLQSVADVVGKSHDATRQMAVRARRKMRTSDLRRPVGRADLLATAMAFSAAVANGDIDQVRALLTDDAMSLSDGGADRHAARRPVVGADRVARFFVNISRRLPADAAIEPAWVNQRPGMIISYAGVVQMVMAIDALDGKVARVFSVLNPVKLAALHHPLPVQ
jgi:RNA polymerase sigma-70 factor, ECF subfamily